MSIYQTIFETLEQPPEAVQALIGAGDIQSVFTRRERVKLFLQEHDWDDDAFQLWLRERAGNLPSAARMAVNAVQSTATWAGSGFALVSEEESQRRLKTATASIAKCAVRPAAAT